MVSSGISLFGENGDLGRVEWVGWQSKAAANGQRFFFYRVVVFFFSFYALFVAQIMVNFVIYYFLHSVCTGRYR